MGRELAEKNGMNPSLLKLVSKGAHHSRVAVWSACSACEHPLNCRPESCRSGRFSYAGKRTLAECFQLFDLIHRVTTDHETISRIATEVVEDLAADNVIYAELRTTPKVSVGALA